MAREAVAQYKPGESFTCTRRQFDPRLADEQRARGEQPEGLSGPCGTTVIMHGYHWCQQVCPSPSCLAVYFVGTGLDMGVYLDHGWFDAPTAANIRAYIAANGVQYVPEFTRLPLALPPPAPHAGRWGVADGTRQQDH